MGPTNVALVKLFNADRELRAAQTRLDEAGKNVRLQERRVSYCDLSLFQLIAGLRYAFPRAMTRLEPSFARITALHERIAARPRITAYLKSARRIAFNEQGIFRSYPELDAAN